MGGSLNNRSSGSDDYEGRVRMVSGDKARKGAFSIFPNPQLVPENIFE